MNLQLKMNVNHILLTPKTIGVVSGFVLYVQNNILHNFWLPKFFKNIELGDCFV